MPRLTAAAALFFILLPIGAQTLTEPPPAFEVASVRPAPSGAPYGGMSGGPGSRSPGQIVYSATTLRAVLCKAYGVERYQISAPPWLDQERFDITAKIPPNTTKAQFQRMLQSLLADRFKLDLHKEAKPLPVYALLIAKNGLKLKVSSDSPAPPPEPNKPVATLTVTSGKDGFPTMAADATGFTGMILPSRATFRARRVTTKEIADFLKDFVDRPVLDRTGLKEKYDLTIMWIPEKMPGGAQLTSPDAVDAAGGGVGSGRFGDEAGYTIYAAIQKYLGLRLEPRKEPIEMLVIDRAEKVPSEN